MQLQDLTAILLTQEVIALSAGIFAVLVTLNRTVSIKGRRLARVPKWWRIMPLLPLVLGVAGAFLPGVVPNAAGWGTQVLVGLWAGFVAAHGRKIFKRLVTDKQPDGTPGAVP